MRVLTLGGGPAGLYASLLLKKADPRHEITVVERNPRDATYGWGVVFSDRTLTEFREADYPTYREIIDRFVLWDAIDIRYRGEVVRASGQGFSGISRKRLLLILQERCADLGVEMRFEEEFSDWDALPGYDLVLAADGVNSFTRERFQDAFRPSIRPGRARFIWFGTSLPLDSFTFIFRETEHGLFQVHAYPFEGTTSTFIVECREDVWRRAGLEGAGEEESMAFCEKLFAPELRGHGLLSNKSEWITFNTVKTRTWRHGNVVLLGDAAHTAHFSIGSGTKLAMEDAIALAAAFERHGDDLDAALSDYELERRPAVERFQEAARQSQTYFEELARYLHMEPTQFAFLLLTRSGRVDYDDLRLRDPALVDGVDRWFAGRARGEGASPVRIAPPPMFAPLRLRGVEVMNRVALSPRPDLPEGDGVPGRERVAAYVRAARRGPGLLVTEIAAVSPEGRITPGDPGMFDARQVAAWGRLVAAVREASGSAVALQLGHAGRRGATRPRSEGLDRPLREGGWPLLAASAVPYTARSRVPRAMDRADMDGVRDDFVRAAEGALEAGFDMLLLNMAHGYLLAGFISPLTNLREDEYGGALRARMRFPLEVLEAVRAAWPEERPLGVAYSATDWAEGGLPREEALEVAALLRDHGCDLLHPLAGQTVSDDRPTYGRLFLAPYAEVIRNEARVATMTSGGITTSGQVNTLLAAGRADLCLMD